VVEAEGGVASALDDLGCGCGIACFDHALMGGADGSFVVEDEAYVEHGWIAGAGGVFAVHQDEVEGAFTFEDGEFVAAAALGDFEVEAALEEVGEAGDV